MSQGNQGKPDGPSTARRPDGLNLSPYPGAALPSDQLGASRWLQQLCGKFAGSCGLSAEQSAAAERTAAAVAEATPGLALIGSCAAAEMTFSAVTPDALAALQRRCHEGAKLRRHASCSSAARVM